MSFHLFFVYSLKVLVLTVVCILSSYKPLFAPWSAFSLPGIPVWAGIQLIVGPGVNLEAASLMALVIVFKSSFLLFSIFTAVKESVCIVIVSLVSLAFSSATRMAVIQYRCGVIKSNDYFLFLVYNCRSHPCPVT